jgi:hypothetical protein
MQDKYLRLAIAALFLTLSPVTAQAEDTRVQELGRKLRERDKVILELLERVEALERRVGVARSARESGEKTAEGLEKTSGEVTGGEPGAIVVTEGEAERALERSLTREGALLLPMAVLEIEPGLTYSRQEDSAPSFVISGGGTLAARTERNADSVTADLALRLGLPWDSQVEIGIPYRWREVETVTNAGFSPIDSASESGGDPGDARLGLAKTLFREGLRRPDLVGRVTWDTDSGSRSDNGVALGGGFHELRGSLTAIKRQDPIAFIGELAYQHTFEEDRIQPGPLFAANFGGFVALSPETSLRFLFSGAYQDETELSGSKVDGSDRTIGTFVVGGSTLLAPGTLLNLSAGIGLTDDADDFSLSLSLPIRLDSPFF